MISPYKFIDRSHAPQVKDLDQDSVSSEGQDASSIPILRGVTVVVNTGFDSSEMNSPQRNITFTKIQRSYMHAGILMSKYSKIDLKLYI